MTFQEKIVAVTVAFRAEEQTLIRKGKVEAASAIAQFLNVAPADSRARLYDLFTAKQEG